jgi:hypothetical protein
VEEVDMGTEKDKARYYKEHTDDPDVWEPATAAPSRKQGLDVTVSVRIAADDAKLLRSVAKKSGLRYSDIIREAVSQYVRPRFTLQRGHAVWGIFQWRPGWPSAEQYRLEVPEAPGASHTGPTASVH